MYKSNWILSIFLCCFAANIVALDNSLFMSTSENSRYYISLVQMDYANAFLTCKINGWTLATEQCQKATNDINAVMKQANAISEYWIGGYMQQEAGFYKTWIWLDYESPISYTNWYNPNVGDACMTKLPEATYNFTWYSRGCQNPNYFICESD